MRKMKDSGIDWIGEIPLEKRVIRNKYKLVYTKGKIPTETNEEMKGVPYIGATDLDSSNGYSLYTEDDTVPECCKNDLLVLWDGARAGLAGTNKCGKISSTIVKITADNSVYSPFLYWYYKGFEKYMYQCVSGTTIPHMNKKYVEDIGLLDWTYEEQINLSEYLDEKCGKIDAVLEKQQAIIEKLREYKLSVIIEAVTKGLDPDVPMKDSGIEFIGETPENWDIVKFGAISTVKSQLVSPMDYQEYFQISPEHIEKNSGRLLEYSTVENMGVIGNNNLFHKGDILYTKIRPNLNKVVIAPFDGLCSAEIYPIETTENIDFVLYMLLSDYFVSQVSLVIQNRVKMPKINRSELSKIWCSIPSLEEQRRIVEYLEQMLTEIDCQIEKRQALIMKLDEYKKSLIYEVVTGKKEV